MTKPCSETDTPPRLPAWRIAEYRRLWFGTVFLALANQCERLAVSWLVLVETDSVFLTAASFTVKKVPGCLVAPVAGDISDRVSRSRMLAATALYKAVLLALLAFLSLGGSVHIGLGFVLAALFEENLFLALKTAGPLFFTTPISLVFIALIVIMFSLPTIKKLFAGRRGKAIHDEI